jgi:hypothetical protein
MTISAPYPTTLKFLHVFSQFTKLILHFSIVSIPEISNAVLLEFFDGLHTVMSAVMLY